MKTRLLFLLAPLLVLLGYAPAAFAQGTAFTYQGRLAFSNVVVNGSYDMTFKVFNAASAGAQVGVTTATNAVGVSNGFFVARVDPGASVFTGLDRWLEIAVKTNGSVTFSNLAPRQPLTPSPYAVFAGWASNVTGTVPSAGLAGTYGSVVTFNNAGNSFAGSGSGLTSLNASSLTTGTVGDARLSPNVALLNRSTQTFTGTNYFARLGVTNGFFQPVDTSLFTGLSLQYEASSGEGAILSSYNDGMGYLSFYTKPGPGVPVTKQMMISRNGDVAIDQGNRNNGLLNNGTTNGAGLTFGAGSGEGIASKRTAGGNLYGLDFYTGFANRMSILNDGFVGIGRQTKVSGYDNFGVYSPITNTWMGMYLHGGATSKPFYGYNNPEGRAWTEMDGTDGNKWKLYNGGYHLTVTTSGGVGIGTTAPDGALLDVEGDVRLNDNDLFLRAGTDNAHGLSYWSRPDGPFLYGFNGGALGVSDSPSNSITLSWDWVGNVWVSNNISVNSLTVRGGADLAEPFQMSSLNIPKGSLVIIDEENPGKLKLSEHACDTRVAGIVSGANGINPGITMHEEGLIEGDQQVALSGRVYALADATKSPIKPGDLLTSSDTPGHVMKVTDHLKAQGAIVGKAMSGLKSGKGSVLILVTLQ